MANNGKRLKPSRVQERCLVILRNGGSISRGALGGIDVLTKDFRIGEFIGSPTLDAMTKHGWIQEKEPKLNYVAYYERHEKRRFEITPDGLSAIEGISGL